jgi:hypothetical protein
MPNETKPDTAMRDDSAAAQVCHTSQIVTELSGKSTEKKSPVGFLPTALQPVTCDKRGGGGGCNKTEKDRIQAERLKHDRWSQTRIDLIGKMMLILDLRKTKTPLASRYPGRLPIDHVQVYVRDRQTVVIDDPFIWSQHLEIEQQLTRTGWRIKHLPRSMSTYVAWKCQPRIIAPPHSLADIEFMAELMAMAKFKGNTVLTADFGGIER